MCRVLLIRFRIIVPSLRMTLVCEATDICVEFGGLLLLALIKGQYLVKRFWFTASKSPGISAKQLGLLVPNVKKVLTELSVAYLGFDL